MICIVCNALETRMSSKGKKFIKPMELFRLVRNREHCRECRKPKGAQGKGRAVGGQEQGKEPTRRKTRMSQTGMMLGRGDAWCLAAFGSSMCLSGSSWWPPFPQTFSSGHSNMPRHWRTGLVFAQTNLTMSQESGLGSALMWGSHILTETLTPHQEGPQHADVSIPSIPSETASKHGLNLEPKSFKVSRKLFYHSKISAGCGAGSQRGWGALLREAAFTVLSGREPGTGRRPEER